MIQLEVRPIGAVKALRLLDKRSEGGRNGDAGGDELRAETQGEFLIVSVAEITVVPQAFEVGRNGTESGSKVSRVVLIRHRELSEVLLGSSNFVL